MKNFKDKPFALIGVHLDYGGEDAGVVKRVMTKEQLNWRSFVDRGAIADKWKPAGTPSFYIVDSKGVIRHKWAGAPAAKAIDTALEKLIQETQ
ncbi:MAG: TlpA family protein disulfide reductase [Gammaproteobacteria bacterium]